MTAPKVEPSEVRTAETAVSRSWPSTTRPRLSTEIEERFADIERRNAACYAGMEALTAKLVSLRRSIEDEQPERPATNGERWDDDSLVQSIDEMKSLAERR